MKKDTSMLGVHDVDDGLDGRGIQLDIPDLVRAAGNDAVRAYREFFDDPKRAKATRKLYRVRANRFFRWAGARGLTLKSIKRTDLRAYSNEIAALKSQHEATIYLTPVRGVLGHLARAGVLARDPCPDGQPNGRGKKAATNGPQPSIPLSELKRIVLEIGKEDGWKEGDEDFQAGLVMIAPLSIESQNTAAIAAFTGVPESLVREYVGRLIDNGIWLPDGKIAGNWFDPDGGGLAFMMDVWVATGMLERNTKPEGDDAAPHGEEFGLAAGEPDRGDLR